MTVKKEMKEKYDKIYDNLIVEKTYLDSLTGPYALAAEPNRLFVARVVQTYQGITPSTPPATAPITRKADASPP